MPATISEVIFDKNTLKLSPTTEVQSIKIDFPDGRSAMVIVAPDEDCSDMGIDPYRCRLGAGEVTAKGTPDGDYALTVGKKENDDGVAITFNLHARGSNVSLAQTEIRLSDYFDKGMLRKKIDVDIDALTDEEYEALNKQKVFECGEFIKEELFSLLEAGDPFFTLLAKSINNSFAMEVFQIHFQRKGVTYTERRIEPEQDSDIPHSFGFGS